MKHTTRLLLATLAAILVAGSGCAGGSSSGGSSKCGNGRLDYGEACDGMDFGGMTCQALGFKGGVLACTSKCTLDMSGCTNEDSGGSGVYQPPETCGNGHLDPGEDCDGADVGMATCKTLGFDEGTLGCTPDCRFDTSQCSYSTCGNGVIDGNERCDGNDLGGKTCASLGYGGGTLRCSPWCQYDTSGCYYCGDGHIDPGEECDTFDFGWASCQDYGFDSGHLTCTADCRIDTSNCYNDTGGGGGGGGGGGDDDNGGTNPVCGNGVKETGEECDGADLGGASCQSLGYDSGTLACTSSCTYDESGCESTTEEERVCSRWNQIKARYNAAYPGSWTGSTSSCDPGTYDSVALDVALELTNFYRWLAGLPAVSWNSTYAAKAQECAVMEAAMGYLSHTPSSNVPCYTSDAYDASSHSNIAQGNALRAVHMYMVDWGNESTLGHRRWMLSHWYKTTGIGSTTGSLPHVASCQWVMTTLGPDNNGWTAYPPPGIFPSDLIEPIGYKSVDEVGWSIQSDAIDFSNASVTVYDNGTPRSVTTEVLHGRYGSEYGLRFAPSGWGMRAGHTYRVVITGVGHTIDYSFKVVDCSQY